MLSGPLDSKLTNLKFVHFTTYPTSPFYNTLMCQNNAGCVANLINPDQTLQYLILIYTICSGLTFNTLYNTVGKQTLLHLSFLYTSSACILAWEGYFSGKQVNDLRYSIFNNDSF